LAGARDGYRRGRAAEIRLEPVGPEPVTQLLDGSRAHLTPERDRILREAAGKTLALVAPPSIADHLDDNLTAAEAGPLPERMERETGRELDHLRKRSQGSGPL
jgi:hypothetical protein